MKKPVKRTRVREQADEEADAVLLNVYKKSPSAGDRRASRKEMKRIRFEFNPLTAAYLIC
jgi:hypothetical protein